MQCEAVSLQEAERLTGLPVDLIEALAESGRIPSQEIGGKLYVGKKAFLGWCQLYGRIFNHVARKHHSDVCGYNAFELIWMTQNAPSLLR
jgi:hypothetical protein